MKKYLLLILMLCGAAGCLPPGEPPTGNITDNTGRIPLTPEEKRERMITELTAALLQTAPGTAMQCRSDNASRLEIANVLQDCAKITGLTSDRNSRWQLYSYYTDSEWVVDIIDGGRQVRSIRIPR